MSGPDAPSSADRARGGARRKKFRKARSGVKGAQERR